LLLLLASLVIVCAVVGWSIAQELKRSRQDRAVCALLALFGPAASRVQTDARELLVWYPLARGARTMFPEAFARIDATLGHAFPFPASVVETAHARWTAEWLNWERSHDLDYTVKTRALEEELDREGEEVAPSGRARLAALERDKLERYQQRYEEYVQVGKALTALVSGAPQNSQQGARETGRV
jgi:hypothetical protein